jgi:hypothetical protein
MNWRVILAVVVALVVGAGGGALAEHQRLKNESNKPSASSKDHTTGTAGTTSTTTPIAQLFGSNQTAACPTLTKWYGALSEEPFQLSSKGPWATTKVKVLALHAVITASYNSLLKLATPSAKADIQDLIRNETATASALTKAATAADFANAQKKLVSASVTRNAQLLIRAEKTCGKKA